MKRSVVLVVVIGLMFVVFFLAFAALRLMTQEAHVAERKIRHMRTFYAAQAGMVHALELLRNGQNPANFNIGAGASGYPAAGLPITITVNSGTGINNTDEVIVTVTHN